MNERTDRHTVDITFLGVIVLLGLLLVMLGRVILSIPIERPGLETAVMEQIRLSGVDSPVTAVLLNFRGYDTLLEVLVLFLAAVGCWSLTITHMPIPMSTPSPVRASVIRLLAPLMIVVAAYMVWQGSRFAGGAFQGGAVLASLGVLLLVSNIPWIDRVPAQHLRYGLVAGPLVFLIVATGCLVNNGHLLQYPLTWAGSLLLLIEVVCAVSIGLTLAALFAGGRPVGDLPEINYSQSQDNVEDET